MARRGGLGCILLLIVCWGVYSGCHLIFPFNIDTPSPDSIADMTVGYDRSLEDQGSHPDLPVDLLASSDLALLDLSPGEQGTGCPSSVTVHTGYSCPGGKTAIGGGISCTGGAVNSSWPSLAGWDGTCTGLGVPSITVICATNAPSPIAQSLKTPDVLAMGKCKTAGEKPISGGCQCASGKLLTSIWVANAWKCECSEIGTHTAWAFCVSNSCPHATSASPTTDLSVTKHVSIQCPAGPRIGGGATIWGTDPPNSGLVTLGPNPNATDVFEAIAEPSSLSGWIRVQADCLE